MATNSLTAKGKHIVEQLVEALGKEEWEKQLAGFQELIDDILRSPQFQQYARQGQLGLLDSKFQMIDKLIIEGIVKVDRIEGKALMDRVFGA